MHCPVGRTERIEENAEQLRALDQDHVDVGAGGAVCVDRHRRVLHRLERPEVLALDADPEAVRVVAGEHAARVEDRNDGERHPVRAGICQLPASQKRDRHPTQFQPPLHGVYSSWIPARSPLKGTLVS